MLILTMIVKNESRIIRRCIESTLPYIQGIMLCDTGSTDNTVNIVEQLADEYPHIEVHIDHHAWVSFGHNRTLSFESARAHFGSRPDAWCLLMDADMTLVVHTPAALTGIPADCAGCLMQQRNGSLYYNNIRMLRLSEPWVCNYPTHEVWQCNGKVHTLSPSDVYIVDAGDGGSKADKFERDYRLLSKYLREHPNDPRTLFYLAETCRNSGRYDEAIQYYQRRHDVGDWNQERWYSLYQLGHIHAMRDWKTAIEFWTRATKLIPERLEAPFHIARTYRENGESFMAYIWAKYCYDKRTHCDAGALFVDTDIYRAKVLYEMAISAFYGNDFDTGAEACDLAAACHRLGWEETSSAVSNRRWYPGATFPTDLLTSYSSATLGTGEWSPMNPSILVHDGELILNLRFVNYKTTNLQHAFWYDRDVIKTTNVLVRKWTPKSQIFTDSVNESQMLHAPNEYKYIQGYEDLRLFACGTRLYALATVREAHGETGRNCMHWLRADTDMEKWTAAQVSKIHIAPSVNFDVAECEKNWIPIQRHDGLVVRTMYHWDPMIALDIEFDSFGGTIVRVHRSAVREFRLSNGHPFSLVQARGSSGGIPWVCPDHYLFLVHFLGMERKQRWYYQRFVVVEFTPVPTLVAASHLFKFSREPIEIPSITECPWDDSKLVLAMGVNDSYVEMRTVYKADIANSLKKIV